MPSKSSKSKLQKLYNEHVFRVFATVKVSTAAMEEKSLIVIYGGWWQIPDFYLKSSY